MERNYAIGLAVQYKLLPQLVDIVRDSHNDYLRTTPVEMRARYNSSARAHLIHRNVMFHCLTRLGEAGSVRLKEYRQLKYLFAEGDPMSMAIRIKRVERLGLRSHTYPTKQQNDAFEDGRFLFDDSYPHHLITGYTEAGDDANPELERIVLTRELRAGIDWWHLLWRADSKAAPIETGYDQPMLPQYRIKPKKVVAKANKVRKQGTDPQ